VRFVCILQYVDTYDPVGKKIFSFKIQKFAFLVLFEQNFLFVKNWYMNKSAQEPDPDVNCTDPQHRK
jgi:hypothetical protein